MKRFGTILVALFGLAGCADALPALAAMGASAATTGGTYFLSAVQKDAAMAAEWRGSQKAIVAQALQAMLSQARALENGADWPAAKAMYLEALAFNECHQPQILAERLAARYRRVKGEDQAARAPPDDCGVQATE